VIGDIIEIEDEVWAILEERDSGLLKVQHCETRERRVAWKTENSITFSVPNVPTVGGVARTPTVKANWQDGLSAHANPSAALPLKLWAALWP